VNSPFGCMTLPRRTQRPFANGDSLFANGRRRATSPAHHHRCRATSKMPPTVLAPGEPAAQGMPADATPRAPHLVASRQPVTAL
jgi:hypothetical protein